MKRADNVTRKRSRKIYRDDYKPLPKSVKKAISKEAKVYNALINSDENMSDEQYYGLRDALKKRRKNYVEAVAIAGRNRMTGSRGGVLDDVIPYVDFYEMHAVNQADALGENKLARRNENQVKKILRHRNENAIKKLAKAELLKQNPLIINQVANTLGVDLNRLEVVPKEKILAHTILGPMIAKQVSSYLSHPAALIAKPVNW